MVVGGICAGLTGVDYRALDGGIKALGAGKPPCCPQVESIHPGQQSEVGPACKTAAQGRGDPSVTV